MKLPFFFLQYIHGLAARGVHYFHRPGPILQDVGFYLLPVGLLVFVFVSPPLLWSCTMNFSYGLKFQELGQDRAYISETVFTTIFLSFIMVSCFSIISHLFLGKIISEIGFCLSLLLYAFEI